MKRITKRSAAKEIKPINSVIILISNRKKKMNMNILDLNTKNQS